MLGNVPRHAPPRRPTDLPGRRSRRLLDRRRRVGRRGRRARDPYAIAAAIDRFSTAARGRPSPHVLIASADQAAYAMPAASWAARSGDSVLFAHRDSVPSATLHAVKSHSRPDIYILGPDTV